MKKNKLIRAHIKFDREINDIVKTRILKGIEKDPRKIKATSSRITLAMIRDPLFAEIKEHIINAELKDEKLLQ